VSESTELAAALLAALRTVPGLAPAAPRRVPALSWMPVQFDTLAVDVDTDMVEVRVVATALPLPPLLRRAEAILRAQLAGTPWSNAGLRLVVTDIDASAFEHRADAPGGFRTGDGGHPIGS
jgi:hypothetical protein